MRLVYRPPGHNITADKKLCDKIIEISNSCENIIFYDFNLPVIGWGNPLSSHTGHNLHNSLSESALSQHVEKLER